MPIMWRYLLRNYIQVFLLSLSGFIAVLLVTRFQEIAKFATAAHSFTAVFLFTLYQIPYILPLAVPISCLIASILLFQKLSHSHELTAFRACGVGLIPIAYPMLIAGVLIGFCNFLIASEIAPYSRGLSRQLVFDLIASNPLIILQKDTVIKMDGIYSQTKHFTEGKLATDVILLSKNGSGNRLSLMSAKQLQLEDHLLYGTDVTFLSTFDSKIKPSYDHLLIENQKQMNTLSSNLTRHMQTADWIKSTDYLPLKLLIAKQKIEKQTDGFLSKKGKIEITKRIALGISAFTFTLIGVAYGLEIGRVKRKKGILMACALAGFFMISFVATKSLKSSPFLTCIAYLLPHPIIYLFCIKNIRNIARGNE